MSLAATLRTPRFSLSGLRPRLVLLALVPPTVAALLLTFASTWVSDSLKEERSEAVLVAGADRAAREIDEAARRLQALATAVAQRPDLGAALQAGDQAATSAIAAGAFRALRAVDGTVAVVEVTDAAGRVAARGHNPGQSGDDKSAVVDVARALRGETVSGITFSPTSGQFAIGATLAVRLEQRVVGTVKVAGRLTTETAAELARVGGGEALLFGGTRLVAGTRQDAQGAVPEALLTSPTPMDVALRDGHYHALARPLTDIEGRRVGALVVLHSVAAWEAAQRKATLVMGGLGLGVLALALLAGLMAANRIARPLAALGVAMAAIARGVLDTVVPGRERRDEIGTMARALEGFREDAATKARLESEAAAARAERERRAAALEHHTEEFGSAVSGVMATLTEASTRMGATAAEMAATASQTEGAARSTARDATEAMNDLGAVAAAAEELAASVSEVARQAGSAASAARAVAGRAEQADGTMGRLSEAASSIGDVARLIGDIAAQTNLLALNATIEAARAGEAGKGFAVVAGEVKQLAGQTARATKDIAVQIEAIRGVASEAVGVVRGMAGEVQQMGDTAAAIAVAVEEQGAATGEIAASVSRVLDSTRRTVKAMDDATDAARRALEASQSVEAGSTEVGAQTHSLRSQVDQFVAGLRDQRSHAA
jgi:methyl-accepting chemotaxis protein